MKSKLKYSLPLATLGLAAAKPVYAHCPLCVAGAGAGLSLSRLLGIDDSITGVWMGAFLGATSFWASGAIKKKLIPLQKELIYILIFTTTVISFYRLGLINEHNGLIHTLPKLTFGILLGGALFYIVDVVNSYIKKKNDGVLFPYQSIIFSLGTVFVASISLYVVLNYFI